jgi:nicotinate-nucleotide pyrophosphorylase (carboxylating)
MFEYNESIEQARKRNIQNALLEDIGTGDWTAMLIPEDGTVHARLTVRQTAVLCGKDWFADCLIALDPTAKIEWKYEEGELMTPNSVVCEITAKPRAMLSAERPALNFLQTLSWTATITREHVKAIEGASPNPKGCAVLDTRKTIPGLRRAQKYAVLIGGGENQRIALWDGILIKENHIAASGGVTAALRAALALNSGVGIQIEVENLAELQEALNAGAENILIDNFSLDDMRKAVEITAGRALLEASGGINLDQLRKIAETGVDRISIGKLTKDVIAVDFSLRVL